MYERRRLERRLRDKEAAYQEVGGPTRRQSLLLIQIRIQTRIRSLAVPLFDA